MVTVRYRSKNGRTRSYDVAYEGIIPNLRRRYETTSSDSIKETRSGDEGSFRIEDVPTTLPTKEAAPVQLTCDQRLRRQHGAGQQHQREQRADAGEERDDARKIGNQLKVDWTQVDLEEFRSGLAVELEHGAHDFDQTTLAVREKLGAVLAELLFEGRRQPGDGGFHRQHARVRPAHGPEPLRRAAM